MSDNDVEKRSICDKCITNGIGHNGESCPVCKYYPEYLELRLAKAKERIETLEAEDVIARKCNSCMSRQIDTLTDEPLSCNPVGDECDQDWRDKKRIDELVEITKRQAWVIAKFSGWSCNDDSDCPYTEHGFCPNRAERKADYDQDVKDIPEVDRYSFEPTDDGNCDYMTTVGGCFAEYYKKLYNELPKPKKEGDLLCSSCPRGSSYVECVKCAKSSSCPGNQKQKGNFNPESEVNHEA